MISRVGRHFRYFRPLLQLQSLPVNYAKRVTKKWANNTTKLGSKQKQTPQGEQDQEHTPMMRQYLQMREDNPGYVILFQAGDFFESFFDDAKTLSGLLNIALTQRRYRGKEVPMAGIPQHALDSYLYKLVKIHGLKVAVCQQTEDAAEARDRKTLVARGVTRLVTPGTLVEENMLNPKAHNYLLSLSCTPGNEVGLAWLDLSTGQFQLSSTTVDLLASEITRINPNEVLVTEEWLNAFPQLNPILKEQHVTLRPEEFFEADEGESMLRIFFPMDATKANESDIATEIINNHSKIELSAIGGLLHYIRETQRGRNPLLSKPDKHSSHSTMHIDASSQRALELVRSISDESANTVTGSQFSNQKQSLRRGAFTVLSVIDSAVTGPGSRLLRHRLTAPSTELEEINSRLDAVEYFVTHRHQLIDSLRSELGFCHDMERSLQRLSLDRGSPKDLAAIQITLTQAAKLKKLLLEHSDIQRLPTRLQYICKVIDNSTFHALIDELKRALVDNPPHVTANGGFIRRGYSDELDDWLNVKEKGYLLINELQEKYRRQTGATSLKIRSNTIIGFFIEITAKDRSILQHFTTQFKELSKTANGYRYKSAELTEMDLRIRNAQDEISKLELACFKLLCDQILSNIDSLKRSARAIAELDVHLSLALTARTQHWCRPNLDTTGTDFVVERGRHLVVEAAHKDHGLPFTANDCLLRHPDSSLWLITGPNMGGKSTFLRQNALIAILAQMGSFVPAQSASFGIVDRLFTRIGASDDLANDRSTFMVEMQETASILRYATRRSLVIMDEVGRGTSILDGLAIAWAVLEHLSLDSLRCRTLFATHYHELSDLSKVLSNVQCHTILVDEQQQQQTQSTTAPQSITFTHKIVPGIANRSYGVFVAKLAGLPDSVTTRAEFILDKLEHRYKRLDILQIQQSENND